MHILNLASAVPKNYYTTQKLLEAFPCQLPEKVKQNILNTGVQKRYLLRTFDSDPSVNGFGDQEYINLCAQACENALRRAETFVEDINYLVATYDANPLLSPGLSYVLIPKLGLSKFVKHVNLQGVASTALPKALDTARNYLAAHPDDRVLVCISGVSSFWFQNQVRKLDRVLDIEQISRIKEGSKRREELRRWVAVMECFLFGDGVFAAVLSNKPKQGLEVKNVVEVSNVEAGDCAAGYSQLVALDEPFRFGFFSHLDKEIPNLGAKYTTIALERLFGKEKGELEKARKWAVHTGSQKILQRLSEQHNIAAEKLLESREVLAEYGNLAGASLPFIIEKIMAHRSLKKGDLILMVGYGWGFTAAAGTLEYTG